jgi:oligopeptidase B
MYIVKLDDKHMDKGVEKWETFITPKSNQVIEDFDAFHDFVAVYLKTQGIAEILICDINTGKQHTIGIDGEIGEIAPAINQNYNESRLRFTFTSSTIYDDLYEYDHITGEVVLLQSNKLRGPEIIRSKFITQRIEVPGHDGESIPMTLLHHSDLVYNRLNK